MELILGMLWLAGIVWAGKQAAREISHEFRKSRAKKAGKGKLSSRQRGRHAAAWWTREARHGFPVTRAGFHKGWLAHQTAMAQRRAQIEEAKTSHLEARASVLSELAAHRKRQAEAQKLIDQATAPPTRRVDGKPETEAETRFFDLRESGYTGPTDQDGNIPDPSSPLAGALPLTTTTNGHNGHAATPAVPTPTGGTPMATPTDGSFTDVIQAAKEQAAQAEAAAADVSAQRKRAEQIAQEMEAADVDAASVAEQMEHVAQLQAAETALENVTETAAGVSDGVQRRHGGIKEAHDDAPVSAAESGWYEE